MQTYSDREDGFTLIELLVVILIIGILSAIAIPAFLNQRKSAVDSAVKSDVSNASKQVETWVTKQGATKKALPAMSDTSVSSASANASLAALKVSDGTKLYFYGDSASYCITGINPGGSVANTTVDGSSTASATKAYGVDASSGGFSGLNLRAEPSTSGTVLKAVSNGQYVTGDGTKSGVWMKVTHSGTTGWIDASTYVFEQFGTESKVDTSGTTFTQVNLRPAPGTSNTPITALAHGTTVYATGQTATADGLNWVEVSHLSIKGWMDAKYVKAVTGGTVTSTSTDSTGSETEGYKYDSVNGGMKTGKCTGTMVFTFSKDGFKAT